MMPYKDKNRYHSDEYKEYQRNYQRGWYERHKTKRSALIRARKAAMNEYIQSIKNEMCCADCGQRHPATLHFHHLNSEDKLFNIGEAVRKGFGPDKIKKEIEKCIVLCANCHAIRHYNMRMENQPGPGIAGQLEELDILLAINPEEDADNI
jgi:hypothetical protein